MDSNEPPRPDDGEESCTLVNDWGDGEDSLNMDVKDRSSVQTYRRRFSTSSAPNSQKQLKARSRRRTSSCGEMNQMCNDALEDLEVSSGASIAANVIPHRGKKDKEVLSRSPFTALLEGLADEHGRAVMQLAELKSECSSLRGQLETLGQRHLIQPGLQTCPPDGALPASSGFPGFSNSSLGTPNGDSEDLRLLANQCNTHNLLPGLLNPEAADKNSDKTTVNAASQLSIRVSAASCSPRSSLGQDSMMIRTESLTSEISETDSVSKKFSVHLLWARDMNTVATRKQPTVGIVASPSADKMNSMRRSRRISNASALLESQNSDACLQYLIRYPTSPRQVAWDLLGAVLILYDLVAIPLRVFDPPDTAFTKVVDWFVLMFWTLNMFASLTVGYFDGGKYVMNPKLILKQYMKLWLWIDLAVVAPDWAFTIINAQDNAGNSVKFLRILRLIRCMRLLRLAKLKWIIASIKDLINSEAIDIAFSIAKMIVCLIAINHFIACFWYGTSLIDGGESWVKFHGFENEHWTYQYVTSFHWAITQFTPASMHIQPQNIYERTFSVMIVIAGLVGFSYLVGSITGSLADLRKMNEDAIKQFWNLRRFLKKSQVPMALRIRIEKYLDHAWQLQKDTVVHGNLPILKLLTEQLRNELDCAICMPHLDVHPLFEYLCSTSAVAMQRIATKALDRRHLARGESHFHPGEIAQHMSFVVKGRLYYSKLNRSEMVDSGEDWITEPAMWTPEWMTLGELVAVSVSELLEVSASKFAEAIRRTPQVSDRVCIYASNFIQHLNEQDRDYLSDICQGDIIGEDIKKMLTAEESEGENSNVLKKQPSMDSLPSKRSTSKEHPWFQRSLGNLLKS